jgi:hypothetical protein
VSGDLLAIAWARPWALALLAVPLVLAWFALRRRSDVSIATSDLDPWRGVEPRGGDAGPRPPRRIPWAHLFALAALITAALAVVGPARTTRPLVWTCVVDASPSMDLPLGAATRREVAIDTANELARRHGAELRWPAGGASAGFASDASAASASRARAVLAGGASWLQDAPDVLWITDASPRELPQFAGSVASGGDAVPGPIAVAGADRIDWDGEHVARVAGAAPPRTAVVEGLDALPESLGEPLRRVLAAWADARGVRVESAEGDDTVAASIVLRIRALGPVTASGVLGGRDGWTARGPRLGPLSDNGDELALEPWLRIAGEVAIAAGTGRIELGWLPGEPSDGAAFAVSWARLFDACALPPTGIVPLEERVAAGPASAVAPAGSSAESSDSMAWMCAVLATLLALAALLARRA